MIVVAIFGGPNALRKSGYGGPQPAVLAAVERGGVIGMIAGAPPFDYKLLERQPHAAWERAPRRKCRGEYCALCRGLQTDRHLKTGLCVSRANFSPVQSNRALGDRQT
jgi:hypothetical protein